jgi:hypothetical protein
MPTPWQTQQSDIKLVGVLPVFVCWVNHAFGLMLVLMMPHMLRLSRSAFMHAIAATADQLNWNGSNASIKTAIKRRIF